MNTTVYMHPYKKSEWFKLSSPIGEPEIAIREDVYMIERTQFEDGKIVWYGQATNWVKEPGKGWTKLAVNENAKALEKCLPDIVYGEDRHIFVPCEEPIYETLYRGVTLTNSNMTA